MKKNYKIITAASAPELEKLVNAAIEKGMHPAGELQVLSGTPESPHITTWVQVMRSESVVKVKK